MCHIFLDNDINIVVVCYVAGFGLLVRQVRNSRGKSILQSYKSEHWYTHSTDDDENQLKPDFKYSVCTRRWRGTCGFQSQKAKIWCIWTFSKYRQDFWYKNIDFFLNMTTSIFGPLIE